MLNERGFTVIEILIVSLVICGLIIGAFVLAQPTYPYTKSELTGQKEVTATLGDISSGQNTTTKDIEAQYNNTVVAVSQIQTAKMIDDELRKTPEGKKLPKPPVKIPTVEIIPNYNNFITDVDRISKWQEYKDNIAIYQTAQIAAFLEGDISDDPTTVCVDPTYAGFLLGPIETSATGGWSNNAKSQPVDGLSTTITCDAGAGTVTIDTVSTQGLKTKMVSNVRITAENKNDGDSTFPSSRGNPAKVVLKGYSGEDGRMVMGF